MTNTICIIPARGGSKGIPKKNLVQLGDLSLLEHTIKDAYELRCPIYVTTDDDEIGFVAQEADAVYIKRPVEISGDDASTEDAVLDVLERLSVAPDTIVVLLQCTSPFRKPGELALAVRWYGLGKCDSMFSGYKLYPFVWDGGAMGSTRVDYPINNRPTRQEKNALTVEDGSFYVFKAGLFTESKNRVHGKIAPWIHNKIYGKEIDTWEDLEECQQLLNWLEKSGKI
jgi:CMP-N,N'-diacetyllegionaminic acid synthase